MKCKNLKIKTKKRVKFGYCKLHNKEVSVFCSECSFEVKYDIEKIKQSNGRQIRNSNKSAVKQQKNLSKSAKTKRMNCRATAVNLQKKSRTIKQRSNKLAKAEKNRFSIIYQDLTKCCVEDCLTPYYGVQKNEVFDGSYRQLSIKHGMVCPLCKNHHDLFHSDREFALYYKRMFQDKFVEEHSMEGFLKIFKMDYYYRK